MANVIRLVNGGSIQVRTGVIQGVGPQGPTGPSGSQGPDGEQGPQGVPGPIGQILQKSGKTAVQTNNVIAANTDTAIAFGSVTYDDFSAFLGSTSVVTLPENGDYLLSVWLKFDAVAGATLRDLWFLTGGNILARSSRTAIASTDMYCNLTHPYRVAAAPETFTVLVRSGTATGISIGQLTVTRVGSGPQGVAGPQGLTGATGATGATGPAGPTGTANSGFIKYGDMLPH
jgi:hypothetical protein